VIMRAASNPKRVLQTVELRYGRASR